MTSAAPGRAGPSRLHPALRLSLALGACCLALAAAEGALRLWWTPPEWFRALGPAGLYEEDRGDVVLRPGYRGVQEADGGAAIAINALGMRGPEFGRKADVERRLLVLGDSVVWGRGVEAEQAFAASLGPLLTSRADPVVSGNAGVPGHGSKHMAAHMARLDGPFQADAFVVCGCLGDDPLDDAMPERTVFAGLSLQGPLARLVEASPRARLMCRSRAALWFEDWLADAHPERSLLAQPLLSSAEEAMAHGFTPSRLFAGLFLDAVDEKAVFDPGAEPVIPRSLATLRSSLERMAGVAEGRPLVFVVMPTSYQVDEAKRQARLRECGIDPAATERGLAQRRWLETAKAAAVTALDATPILAAAADPAALFLADGHHLSVAGHEAIAAWLAQELARLWR